MPEVPEKKYERDTHRFDCLGIDLNRPYDSVKPGKFPYLKNARSYVAGRIEPRMGLTDIAEVVAGQVRVHSCRRLNDTNGGTYARVVGAGTHLAYGQATFTDLDSGYSGNPFALQAWKPLASPTPYMYVGDSSRMRKVTAAGALDTIGYAPPTAAPNVALSNTPKYNVIDNFDATGTWAQGGSAGAPTLISRTPGTAAGATTTIAQILYDTGTTGWAGVNLTSMVGVGYGERLSFNGGTPEIVTVQDVFPSSLATTISRIIYDSGSTGSCSFVLADPIDQVAIDAIIRNTPAAENARIIGVVIGPDGTKSIRASTTGTWAAGNAVQILDTLRVYLANNHAAPQTVNTDAVRTVVNVGTATLSKVSAQDLSIITTGVPTTPDDYMCIGLRVDHPELITELKVQLDVDSASVVLGAFTGTEFTRNFYTRTFRPSDLTPALHNQQPLTSTQATIAQRQVLQQSQLTYAQSTAVDGLDQFAPDQPTGDDTTPSNSPAIESQQLESGDTQWVGLRFRIAELTRVGTDDTRTLQNVVGLRIVATVTGATPVNLDMDSWWIGGGFGPDSGPVTAIPYAYRYRVRNPSTNVRSNPSPATRLLVSPFRQSVSITPTQYAAPSGTSLTAASLVLDIERFGGQIAEWHYVGTIANAASPFVDTFPDSTVAGEPIMGIEDFQPWPILGVPVSGTTGSVAGTSVSDSGTTFSMSWAMGTRIIINNVPYTIYRVVSTALIELVENAGSQTGVAWRIDEPTILAQPLACLWVNEDTFFACGDPVNPGRLYWSNPGSETTQPINYRDVTSPSEPLMNGLAYNLRGYVFSSENMFQILRSTSLEAISENTSFSASIPQWISDKVPNGKGLFARWSLTLNPAPIICFLSKDGIYATNGGSPVSLTDEDLFPLFPSEGNIGTNTNGVMAPNITSTYASLLRMEYYDEYLYFDYTDVSLGVSTLVLTFDRGGAPIGWFWDIYTPNIVFHYGEEGSGVHSLLAGGTNTHLYQYAGDSDNGSTFSMEITTPSLDQGDPRANKLYGDIMLDANTFGINVTATPYFNNNASSVTAVTVNTTTHGRDLTTIPLGTAWQTYRNISLNLVCTVSTDARPEFYIWEPRWTFESAPIAALSWEISPTSFGMDNFKHIGICKISHVSTADLALTFTIDGTAQTPIAIANSGGVYAETIFRVPVMKGKLIKLRLSSTVDFRLDSRDSFIDVKDWGSDSPYRRMRVFGDYAFVTG